MTDSSKVRLVRCPKCENLLQELVDYSVYQCGGCGAVLREHVNLPEYPRAITCLLNAVRFEQGECKRIFSMLKYRERHCPRKELLRCLIPAPPKYKTPFKWPQSRDFAWYDNIPHRELSIEKAVQNWIQVEGDRFRFPGGGTMFPRGADAYIDDINELIPLKSGSISTAIDTGCGVASWGAYLLRRDILAMSFAPRDTHEAHVQFALERGF